MADPPATELAVTLVRAALLCFLCASGAGDGPRNSDPVRRAQEAARSALSEPLRLTDLARAAAVTPEHLCRLFRTEVGASPMAFVWAERTRRALHLLLATGLSTEEIAVRCGLPLPIPLRPADPRGDRDDAGCLPPHAWDRRAGVVERRPRRRIAGPTRMRRGALP